ncbi:MAG TPA: hypothetical protein VHD56_04870 [Tepidisphaeraceae bacterium]|nr:hypothetical protein [Tepidisphaeraceae bacterium]
MDAIYFALREKLIPADESVSLQGGKFIDWENQADLIEKELCTAFLEERVALEAGAQVESGGRCPHCGSDRVYLMKEESKMEVRSPHGAVVMYKQRCRCRACDRTFSPQERDWQMPTEAELTPKAAARVGREAATQTFDPGARAINIDWGTTLDGKQIERWGEALGQTLVEKRQQELEAFVALSALARRDEDRIRAIEAGFQRHLSKPVPVHILIKTIEDLVNGKNIRAIAHA